MKKLKSPYLSINCKSYCYGKSLIELCKYADELAKKNDVDIVFDVPSTDIYPVVQSTKHIFVYAQALDGIEPSGNMASALGPAIKEAGADGCVINHLSRPLDLHHFIKSLKQANELNLLTSVCVTCLEEALIAAAYNPTEIVLETPLSYNDEIDKKNMYDMTRIIKEKYPNIFICQGLPIKSKEDVCTAILNGADTSGASSAIVKNKNPKDMLKHYLDGIIQAKKAMKMQ